MFQLEDVNRALEGERTKFAGLDKNQRKFDQKLAEEKATSERLLCCFLYMLEDFNIL